MTKDEGSVQAGSSNKTGRNNQVLIRKLAGLPASPVLTLVLLVVLLVFLYLGTTDMFKNSAEIAGRSSMIFFSPLFLAVVLLFEINLISCTFRQLKKAVNRRLKGSVIFHIGLVIIVLGALIQFAFGFTGYFRIIEGDVFESRQDNYYIAREGVFYREEPVKSELFLQKIDIPPDDQEGTRGRGLLTLVRDGEVAAKQWVSADDSLSYGLMDIAFNRMGYYLMLDYTDSLGKTLAAYPLLLQSVEILDGTGFSGSLKIQGTDYTISLKSEHVPEFQVTVDKKVSGEQAETIYKGRAAVGDTVSLDRNEITLSHLVPWIIFRIRYEYGFYIIYAGMIIATAGMLLLYGRLDL
ncbi:hypothetical protein [Phosphitispora sp. TUW77]|uniref:hypothetical protein n=1 Tax=Phosphitispora sp. TUW77 TaxID=3152361 RepID=UPI003AB5623C